MAKTKNTGVKISSSAKNLLAKFTGSNDQLLKKQNQITSNELNTSKDLFTVRQSLTTTINKTYNDLLGNANTEVSPQELNQIITVSKNKGKANKDEYRNRLETFRKQITDENNSGLQAIIDQRRGEKRPLYESYNLITNIIPKMEMALDTYSDAVISPDDFTKRILVTSLEVDNVEDNVKRSVLQNVKSIIEKYDIEDRMKEDIHDYLKYGEMYYAVISMNSEVRRMLNENGSFGKSNYITLNESLHYNDFSLVRFEREAKVLFEEVESNKVISQLDEFISEKFLFGNKECLLTEADEITNGVNDFVSKLMNPLQGTPGTVANQFDTSEKEQAYKDSAFIMKTSDTAILKRLAADRVVKLEYDEKCYGYLYIDIYEDPTTSPSDNKKDTFTSNSSDTSNANIFTHVVFAANDVGMADGGDGGKSNAGKAQNYDEKLKFMADYFSNKLERKMNLKILRNDNTFKSAIYHTLRIKEIVDQNKKVRVTFFQPVDIIHMDRGRSIFDNVLFFCKLYITAIITALMQNVVRGADKRAYYVEMGLENDIANQMNSVIRDIKTKDITSIHNMDIQSLLNIVGEFNDYFIPTIDGNKPIVIEDVPGLQNTQLDNEFLTWLSNNIYSGLGLPAAYFQDIENVDFAKTLSMQNARFIRSIITEQKICSVAFTKLIQAIYKIEYGDSINGNDNGNNPTRKRRKTPKKNENDIKFGEYDKIKVVFPSPMALNMTNILDQISNFDTISQPIVDSYSKISDEDKDTFTKIFKGRLMREFIPSMNWENIDAILEDSANEVKRKKLLNGTPTDDSALSPTPTDTAPSTSGDATDMSNDSSNDDNPAIDNNNNSSNDDLDL